MDKLNTGDWEELFTLTDSDTYTELNTKFYQDINWNNDGLKQGCIQAVNYILDQNSANIREVWELDGVKLALRHNEPELHDVIESIVSGVALVASPNVTNINESVYKTLEEAEVLIAAQGATSAYDRMHTALHGFLKQVCSNNNISFASSDAITALLPKINNFIKLLPDEGRNDNVFVMLRSANSMLDKINYMRNHHSMSHPNEILIKESDAKFAINLARSIMTYIDDLLA